LKRGISGGERRRLAIGNEVVTGPKIVFLDEPYVCAHSSTSSSLSMSRARLSDRNAYGCGCVDRTTGLDSHNALRVMRSLKLLCQKHRVTIICTVHQPRSNIFHMFDYLLLLCAGT